jgi:DNA-binding Lrp family transcriptional regulator
MYISETGDLKKLKILFELTVNPSITQRDLANRIGCSLAMTNNYLKQLVSENILVQGSSKSKKKIYTLSTDGLLAEKYMMLTFMNELMIVLKKFMELFNRIDLPSDFYNKKIVLYGVGEICESFLLFLLYVKNKSEIVSYVFDDNYEKINNYIHGHVIKDAADIEQYDFDYVLITVFNKPEKIREKLVRKGVSIDKIIDLL